VLDVVPMHGAGCTVRTTLPRVGVGNTVFQASRPRLESLRTMHDRSFAGSMDALLTLTCRKEESTVTKYDFTLRFALPSERTDMDAVADILYGGGCDDALVGIGRPGSVALDFTRAAHSAREAVMSAISDVTRALPRATLIEAAPDLVGITDVADIVGCTRQNIRQLMAFGTSRVPAPAREGRPALWHLSLLLNWLAAEKRYQVDAALLDLADTTMRVNLALHAIQAEPELEDDLRALLA
jgi:hypothetical protein